MEIYNQFDVVVVPFPFTDRLSTKRRPALVLSSSKHFNAIIKHSVLSMITSQTHYNWPLDMEIVDLKKAGLTSQSIIRMKLFTLDNRLILKKIGLLSNTDQENFIIKLKNLFF